MKNLLLLLLLLPLTVLAYPNAKRVEASLALYREANTPAAQQHLRTALLQEPGAFLNAGQFEPGCLYLLSGQRVSVTGLRYHLGQRVVEVQDSLQADSTSFWPLSALRGFDLGSNDEPASLRRYRSRLVHENHQADRQEAVQILTATDAGPLLLAYLPMLEPVTHTHTQVLLTGEGHDALHPLAATETEVRHLLGGRANKVQAYARIHNLHFCAPTEVAQMLDYYNQQAAVAVR